MIKENEIADMYHPGTKTYYRVKVIKAITEEEANGPDFYYDEKEEGLNAPGPKYF